MPHYKPLIKEDIRDSIRAQLNQLREEIAKEDSDSPLRKTLLGKLDELKKDFQEVCHEMDKPDDIRLAEALHQRFCHWNHTDGCGWHYEKWSDTLRMNSSRKPYLDMARRVLKEFTFEQALKFLELTKKY